ncbi:MAG: tail protein X [Pseudomonadota bacterium]
MSIETFNGVRVWRCQDDDMADQIARTVYGSIPGAVETILSANALLVSSRGPYFRAGDVLTLPSIEPPSNQRQRLFE